MVPFILRVVFIVHMSHAFSVTQSLLYNIYPNRSAIIGCEHTAQSGVVADFRLYSVSGEMKMLLCQKDSTECANVFYQASFNKTVFLLLNIGEEAMQLYYQCEFTLQMIQNELFLTKSGKPAKLQRVENEPKIQTAPPPRSPPPNEEIPLLMWILIGVLVSTLLYSGFVTCCCIRLMRRDQYSENQTYVEMRKCPPPQNNIYFN